IEVLCDEVPRASENFLALCASGYYDGTLIHRNIAGFIVQMGDPTGTGKGGASIWGEPFDDEIRATLCHDRRGVVSMANSGANTNGSQFFITYGRQPSLDGKHTVVGRVIGGGDDALAALERVPVNKKYRPVEDTKIRSVTVHANPLADPSCQA
ncbi:Peptidyl-prolyl cis-trans isomerase cyp10, partial [Coemansia sp. RSA 2704]